MVQSFLNLLYYQKFMLTLTNSAITHLNENFAYFTLDSEPELSRYVFEQTFGMQFESLSETSYRLESSKRAEALSHLSPALEKYRT